LIAILFFMLGISAPIHLSVHLLCDHAKYQAEDNRDSQIDNGADQDSHWNTMS